MRYIITFRSTMDAFSLDRMLRELPIQGIHQEVITLPYELSQTCYGLGVSFEANEAGRQSVLNRLYENKVPFRFLWKETEDGFVRDVEGI